MAKWEFMNSSFCGRRSRFLNSRFSRVSRESVASLRLALCSLSFGVENNPGSKVILQSPLGAGELEQKMLSVSEAGGGILVLPKNSTLTVIMHSVTYLSEFKEYPGGGGAGERER